MNKLIILPMAILLFCDGVSNNDFGNYKFELNAYKYPPYEIGESSIIDTLSKGDSMILAIKYVKDEELYESKENAQSNDPVTPGFADGSLFITCDNNIIINFDTITPGENLYSKDCKSKITSENYQNVAGKIYFNGKCKFKSGNNIFTMSGEDNFGKYHKSDCTVFIR